MNDIVNKPKNNTAPEAKESPQANIYNATVNFALNEMRLIWTRYAGFLILQGFILSIISEKTSYHVLLIMLNFIGVICSVVWHILNHAGWLNQNTWLIYAAKINIKGWDQQLFTEWWKNDNALKPTGKIYFLAQLIPATFIIIYTIGLGFSLFAYLSQNFSFAGGTNYQISFFVSVFILLLACIFCYLIEHSEYKDRKSAKDGRTFA